MIVDKTDEAAALRPFLFQRENLGVWTLYVLSPYKGINVVLSDGSAVSFFPRNKYVSKDLDLINTGFARQSRIKSVMENLGFQEQGRYFIHSETAFFVEFPDGPLSVGEEPVQEVSEFELPTGTLKVLSPTDCVKDRLCAFYFWNDR